MGGTTRKSEKPRPETEEPDTPTGPEPVAAMRSLCRRADRSGLIVAGAALAACGGLVLYGVLDPGANAKKSEHRTPTASVTYEVSGQGTADITFQARSEAGKATAVKAAALPWRKTVDVPLGQAPTVSITLGENGGQARCTLAIGGRYVQSATASGTFGRATCTGALPTPPATAS
ncbi:hypothetical protein [Streptomyces sp. NPDC050287]|uniref:hypothetical protein n=1 Tax=Streptomyces sp. NPDC050287 TaxID=3365608 RepID=UPI0037B1EDA5